MKILLDGEKIIEIKNFMSDLVPVHHYIDFMLVLALYFNESQYTILSQTERMPQCKLRKCIIIFYTAGGCIVVFYYKDDYDI